MKKSLYLLPLLLSLSLCARATEMPASSKLANGHWTKIKVQTDGIYQLTYEQLNKLGYENPAAVKVYGYTPSLLVSCSFDVIPGDLNPIHTIDLPDQQKIMFYLADNYDFTPEIWRTKFSSNDAAKRQRHIHANGATYFLSDIDSDAATTGTVSAPLTAPKKPLQSHVAVYYHEKDVTSLTEAGSIFLEPATITETVSLTHPFTVSHLATGDANLLFGAYVAPANTESNSNLDAVFSEGIIAGDSDGSKPNLLLQKEILTPQFRSQDFHMPLTVEPKTHTVTFRIPDNGVQQKACALDFFFVKYNRTNDVGVRPQSMMYFRNENKTDTFELTGANLDTWEVWNVTKPAAIQKIELAESDGKFYGILQPVAQGYANEVIAFDVTAEQPTPEILGSVDNSNLHAIEVPDMLIITSRPLMSSAEKVADIHRRLQGFEVAVVDQTQIFNEYSSGNTSPEAVRRFVTHMAERNPGKLRGVLLLGPATFNNKDLIADDQPYVISAQCEEPVLARNITTNYACDVYFVSTGEPFTGNPWAERHSSFCVFANAPVAGVGRVPFKTENEINDYYSKVEKYLTELPTYPSVGNYIFASDYSYPYEKSRTHMNDAELAISAMDTTKHGRDITITRCASNIFSSNDNDIIKKVQSRALAMGAQLYAYFGHGTAYAISGSTSVNDPILTIDGASSSNYGVRTPFMHLASCHVAAVDVYNNTLSAALIGNPNGGAVGVIGSGREVFPQNNTELAQEVAFGFDEAANNKPVGLIWTEAVGRFISRLAAYRKAICNTLDYNYIGDPMLPVYKPTNGIVINPIADNQLSYVEPREISGSITDLTGNPAEDFNGTAILTFYDSPLTKANVNANNPSENPGYLPSVEIDQEVIGQTTAEVKNGKFSAMVKAPSASSSANHRVQVFAYSSDATQRALGSISNIDFVEEGTPRSVEASPVEITSFSVEYSDSVSSQKCKAIIKASFSAPAGLTYSNSLVNPVRLMLDGKSQANATDMVSHLADGMYELNYVTSKLDFGRHEATISIIDANGNWAEETRTFIIDNAPEAQLSVAIEGGEANFEVACVATDLTARLLVEYLNGEIAADEAFSGSTHKLQLEPGAYRAYVQLRSGTVAASTPKIQFIIE